MTELSRNKTNTIVLNYVSSYLNNSKTSPKNDFQLKFNYKYWQTELDLIYII